MPMKYMIVLDNDAAIPADNTNRRKLYGVIPTVNNRLEATRVYGAPKNGVALDTKEMTNVTSRYCSNIMVIGCRLR